MSTWCPTSKDVIECLKVTYPQYDYLFIFDRSCGNGLNVQCMSKLFGGKQPIMIDTMMAKHEGYIGSFNPKLQIGDTQRIFFQPEDVGPFWMTNQEWERKCHDIIKPGTKLVKWTKKELIKLLKIKALVQLVRQIKFKKIQRIMVYLP
jgi:hypothetical protein